MLLLFRETNITQVV